jgi:DNA-binding NarL/FixJ family response regulator
MREGVRALLSTQGHIKVVGEASDGEEAIQKVSELSPDVVVRDIGIPTVSGLETTRRISSKYPDSKVIMLTPHTHRNYVQSSFKAGASGCLPKETLATDLISAIDSVHKGGTFLQHSMAT